MSDPGRSIRNSRAGGAAAAQWAPPPLPVFSDVKTPLLASHVMVTSFPTSFPVPAASDCPPAVPHLWSAISLYIVARPVQPIALSSGEKQPVSIGLHSEGLAACFPMTLTHSTPLLETDDGPSLDCLLFSSALVSVSGASTACVSASRACVSIFAHHLSRSCGAVASPGFAALAEPNFSSAHA